MFHEQIKKLEIGKLYRHHVYEFLVFDSELVAKRAAIYAGMRRGSAVTTGWANVFFWQNLFERPVSFIPSGKVFMPVEYGNDGVVAVKVIAENILGWMVKPDYWYEMEEVEENKYV